MSFSATCRWNPGAVPRSFRSVVCPRKTFACRLLTSGIFQPRAAKRASMRAVIDGSTSISSPSASATFRASFGGSLTSSGRAYTALAGSDRATSWPFRSKIDPRDGGRSIVRTR